ncbi:chemotaxis protein CheW [Pseudaquabacterium pictum]|uniref:Chemotaxis protein CheW n=1 Tax=Pseudaquabacterium pictum TaxID=2315236 RepID=A0A480AXX3_9BURK|nr:chemotaxis protein CheW [Rubrivivax pictus]GCL63648.1 chemotaxis protein CheW [Rubrivivax pictus]
MHADLPRSRPRPVPAPAESDHAGCALLRMAVGNDAVAVPIADVREILEVGRLTALPRTPAFVRGVMNLRGAVVPVIDLVARLGHPPAEIGRRSCVVVVEARPRGHDGIDDEDTAAGDNHLGETLVVGLLVDAVYEVFDAPPGDFEPVPPLGTRIDAAYLQGISRVRGEAIGVLALERVLAQQELSALIAAHVPH